MTNKEMNEKNSIEEKLEALRPENIIDREKVKQIAEEERRIIREMLEAENEKRSKK